MAKTPGQIASLAGSGCGGAAAGAFLVGNLVEYLGHHQLGPDDRAGITYALYLGVPMGVYLGVRVAPALGAWWEGRRAGKRRPRDPEA